MKVSIQTKIAELERRIMQLEAAMSRTTVDFQTRPMTVDQVGHFTRMWQCFDKTFEEMGKIFR